MRKIILSSVALGLLAAGPVLAQDPGTNTERDTAEQQRDAQRDTSRSADEMQQAETERTQDTARAEASGEAYVVEKGDTLSQIAEEKLGNPAEWQRIAQLNNIEDPKKLQVGKRLQIPTERAESERTDSSPRARADTSPEDEGLFGR